MNEGPTFLFISTISLNESENDSSIALHATILETYVHMCILHKEGEKGLRTKLLNFEKLIILSR